MSICGRTSGKGKKKKVIDSFTAWSQTLNDGPPASSSSDRADWFLKFSVWLKMIQLGAFQDGHARFHSQDLSDPAALWSFYGSSYALSWTSETEVHWNLVWIPSFPPTYVSGAAAAKTLPCTCQLHPCLKTFWSDRQQVDERHQNATSLTQKHHLWGSFCG